MISRCEHVDLLQLAYNTFDRGHIIPGFYQRLSLKSGP